VRGRNIWQLKGPLCVRRGFNGPWVRVEWLARLWMDDGSGFGTGGDWACARYVPEPLMPARFVSGRKYLYRKPCFSKHATLYKYSGTGCSSSSRETRVILPVVFLGEMQLVTPKTDSLGTAGGEIQYHSHMSPQDHILFIMDRRRAG
jgi:hypothetical protein